LQRVRERDVAFLTEQLDNQFGSVEWPPEVVVLAPFLVEESAEVMEQTALEFVTLAFGTAVAVNGRKSCRVERAEARDFDLSKLRQVRQRDDRKISTSQIGKAK
jgi:hypothetical protein